MVNVAHLIGNVGKDPEVRTTASGQQIASFSLATSQRWKDREGNKQEKTEWHNVVAWGKLADIVDRFVTKGSRLYIQGRIETQSWDDKESGQKRYKTQIVADQMTMLGDRKSGDSGERSSGAEPGDGGGYAGDDSDIPFAP